MTTIYVVFTVMYLFGLWIFVTGKKMDADTEGPFNAVAFLGMYYGVVFMFVAVVSTIMVTAGA